MGNDLPGHRSSCWVAVRKLRLGEEEWLTQSPRACWWQNLGLIQAPGPQDKADSVISLRSCVGVPTPPFSTERSLRESLWSIFVCRASVIFDGVSELPCSAPLDLICPAPRRAAHLDHPQTASVCTGAPGWVGDWAFQPQVDNGWVKRVIFFSHLVIPQVCKSLSQATQSSQ